MIMKTMFRLVAAVLAVVALCALMTSCYEAPPTVIDPVDDTPTTTATATVEEETGPLKPTVSDVFVLNSTELSWNDLNVFEHTMTGDNTAHFDIVATNGNVCSLDVVIDPESGLVTEANITYDDMTQTLLTDDYFELVPIIRAINGTEE